MNATDIPGSALTWLWHTSWQASLLALLVLLVQWVFHALAHVRRGDAVVNWLRTLIKLLQGFSQPATVPGLVGILEDKRQIKRRIAMVATFSKTRRGATLAVALLLGLALVSLTDAQDKRSPEADSASSTNRTVKTQSGKKLILTVTDTETGKPIASAKATANFLQTNGEVKTVALNADAQGRCVLKLSQSRFQKLHVLVYADGYHPKGVIWVPGSVPLEHTVKLAHGPEMSLLLVRLPNGQPAAGAQVVPIVEGIGVGLDQLAPGRLVRSASLRYTTDGPGQAEPEPQTDRDGEFTYRPISPEGVAVAHDAGYARVTTEELAKSSNVITLKPWGRIEGTLRVGASAGVGKQVSARNDRVPHADSITFWYTTETDSNGHFVFEWLPAGQCEVGRYYPDELPRVPLALRKEAAGSPGRRGTAATNGNYTVSFMTVSFMRSGRPTGLAESETEATVGLSPMASVEVRPGETSRVTIGGVGRPVRGKLAAPQIRWPFHWTLDVQGWLQAGSDRSPAPSRQEAARPRYFFEFEADGSFRADDVPPGEYNLIVRDTGADYASLRRAGLRPADLGPDVSRGYELNAAVGKLSLAKQVVVPGSPAVPTDEPLDLGTLELKPAR